MYWESGSLCFERKKERKREKEQREIVEKREKENSVSGELLGRRVLSSVSRQRR